MLLGKEVSNRRCYIIPLEDEDDIRRAPWDIREVLQHTQDTEEERNRRPLTYGDEKVVDSKNCKDEAKGFEERVASRFVQNLEKTTEDLRSVKASKLLKMGHKLDQNVSRGNLNFKTVSHLRMMPLRNIEFFQKDIKTLRKEIKELKRQIRLIEQQKTKSYSSSEVSC